MKLITSLEQILKNIRYLESIRNSKNDLDYVKYETLVRNGRCLFPYKTSSGYAFAPSRFIGYIGNNFAKHKNSEDIDGRETNKAIRNVLRQEPIADPAAEKIFREFCENLKAKTDNIRIPNKKRKYWITDEFGEQLDLLIEEDVVDNMSIPPTDKLQVIKARVGQGKFRDDVVRSWKQCCATGVKLTPILRASHIKPWRDSTNEERLDPFNGLLLTPNLDALFDSGRISFEDNGHIKMHKDLNLALLNELGWKTGYKIKFSAKHLPYLRFHREKYF